MWSVLERQAARLLRRLTDKEAMFEGAKKIWWYEGAINTVVDITAGRESDEEN